MTVDRCRFGDARGAVVLGWLTKLVIVLAVIGVAGFDALSIVTTHLSASDEANAAAQAAEDSWSQSPGQVQLAYDAAAQYAEQHGDRIPPRSFTIAPDGTVHLRVVKTVQTLVVRHIGPLQHLQVIRAEGTATPPTE